MRRAIWASSSRVQPEKSLRRRVSTGLASAASADGSIGAAAPRSLGATTRERRSATGCGRGGTRPGRSKTAAKARWKAARSSRRETSVARAAQ